MNGKIEEPSPVGEGGTRSVTDEVFLIFGDSSSTAKAVPLLPQEKAFLMCGRQRKAPREAGQEVIRLRVVQFLFVVRLCSHKR